MGKQRTNKMQPTSENKPYTRASYALKKKIVKLVQNGLCSANYIAKKHNVSASSVRYWIKRFGTINEKDVNMSKDNELKKLKQRLKDLELIKDFQQDLIAEYELETGKDLSKKFLPEQLAKEIQNKKRKSK